MTQAVEDQAKAQVQNAEFAEADSTGQGSANSSIDLLLDMKIPVTVVIGKAQVPVKDVLTYGPGVVIELDKSIEAPVELYLEDSKFATGTVVVVNDKFAIKINEIISGPTEA